MIVLNEKLQPIEDTAQARFSAEIVVDISDHCLIYLEIWGASTKHPDIMFSYEYYRGSDFMSESDNFVGWLAECASKVTFRANMYRIIKMATKKNAKIISRYLKQCTISDVSKLYT